MTQQLDPVRPLVDPAPTGPRTEAWRPGPGRPGPESGSGYGPPLPLPRFERHAVAAPPDPPDPRGFRRGVVTAVVAVLATAALVLAVLAGLITVSAGPTATGGAAPATSADPAADRVTGRSALLVAYGRLSGATQTFATDLEAHRGHTAAQQRDCATYRAAVQEFRTTAAVTTYGPADRPRVDAAVLPAADRMLADLDTMTTTSSTRTRVDTAGAFDGHSTELDTIVRAVTGD